MRQWGQRIYYNVIYGCMFLSIQYKLVPVWFFPHSKCYGTFILGVLDELHYRQKDKMGPLCKPQHPLCVIRQVNSLRWCLYLAQTLCWTRLLISPVWSSQQLFAQHFSPWSYHPKQSLSPNPFVIAMWEDSC